MTGWAAGAIALVALAGVLWFAMVQPRGLPEATLAVPAAGLLVALGIVKPSAAIDQLLALGPTVGFLAAILVIAHLADHAGVFDWLGAQIGKLSGGDPIRLLRWVFVVAATTTAVLSLDATVVLLTPIVLLTATSVGLAARPHVYACGHLSNSASTLLPVSNLTNLLAFAATGLPFLTFAAVMGLPWLAVILVEYAVIRYFFGTELLVPRETVLPVATTELRAPRFALTVLALTLAGFGASGFVGIEPVWVAVLGAVALALPALTQHAVGPVTLVREAAPLFCLFVLALGVIVSGVTAHGLGRLLADSLPARSALESPGFAALLIVTLVSAGLANVVNNLPATLVMLGALGASAHPGLGAGAHPGLILAVLIGVNIGPNLTYVGSLATLLWRRVLISRGAPPELGEFSRLGLITVPLGLAAGVGALWVSLKLTDGWLL